MELSELKKEAKKLGYKVKTKRHYELDNFLSVNIYTQENKLVTKDFFTKEELDMYSDILAIYEKFTEWRKQQQKEGFNL